MLNHSTKSSPYSFITSPLIIFTCLLIVVSDLNAALIVNAGPDQIVTAGEQVQLDGSASSETDGTIASFHWYQVRGPVVTLESARTAIASFQAPANAELEFGLRLVSDTDEVATDRVVIRTDPYNNILPQANAGIDQIVATGDLVQLDATASSDADGTIIKYRWHQSRGPNVQLIDAQTAVSSFQAPPNAELGFSLRIEDNAGAIATDGVVIRVEPYTNQPPVADAGIDQTIAAGETVQLDGSVSSDADGAIVRYIWTQNRGPSVVLQDSRTATPSFTMLANAELAFTLTVIDDSGAVTRDGILVHSAVNTNQPPVADAGIDQTIAAGETVQLDGSASSDADGAIVRYIWTQNRGPSVVLQDSRTATPSFTMPANAELAFTLTVIDDSGAVTRDGVLVHSAVNTNQPPVADAGIDQTIAAGETVQLDGSASSDADGAIVRYIWTQNRGPSVVLQDSRTATPSFTMPANAELAFTLTVIDDSGAVTRDGVLVHSAVNTNQPPVADAGIDQTIAAGETVQLDGSASSDADGAIVRYIWTQNRGPSVVLQDSRTATPSFTMPANAELAFTLTVIDDSGAVTRDGVLVHSAVNTNQPPVADAGIDQTIAAGETVQLDGSVSSDADGAIVRYIWTQNRGPSVVLQDSRTATPSFTMLANAELAFTLTVIDDSGAVTRDGVLVHSAVNTNQPPVADAGPDLVVIEGELAQLDGSASSDPDGEISRFIWSQRSGPTVQLNDKNSATPNFVATTAGDILLRLIVEDDRGTRVTDDVHITVQVGGNSPPIADAGPDATHLETRNHQFNGRSSSDSDGSIASYLWEQISGPTVNISAANASRSIFSVNMPEVDQDTELRFRLTVTDDGGLSSSDEIVVLVLDNLPPQPLAIDEITIVEGSYHVLDASQYFSFQPEDGFWSLTGYQWRQISGPPVILQYRQYREQVRILAPEVDVATDLIFEVGVEDRFGLPATNTVTVHVVNPEDLPPNSPPVAVAGEDRISSSKYFLIVDGTNSHDIDGEIVSYEWSVIDSPGYVGSFRGDSQYPINHASVYEPGDYTLRLTVTDDRGGISTDDVIVNFNPYTSSTDNPPDADAGTHYKTPLRYWQLDDSLRLDGSDSADANGSIVSFQWQQLSGPTVDIANPDSSVTSFIPQPFDGSATSSNPIEYRFLLMVTDDEGDKDESFVRRQIYLVNSEPTANFNQQPILSLADSVIQLDASSSYDRDPNDYISSYRWSQYYGPTVTFLDNSVQPRVQLPDRNTVSGLASVGIELSVTDLYGADTRFPETLPFWIVSPEYQAALFTAGDDIYVQAGSQVTITGEPYVPAECNPITGCVDDSSGLHWLQLAGPPIELTQSRGWNLSFTAPPITERVELIFGLTKIVSAFNNRAVTEVDPVKVYLVPQGAALTADAGPDQESPEKNLVTLDGSGSYDPHGVIEQFHWIQLEGPQALLTKPHEAITEVALPALAVEADLVFQLTVANDWEMEAVDTVRVRVTPDLTDGDIDADGVSDDNDLFPNNPNEAYDFDDDGIGDTGDTDRDGDGVDNDLDYYPNDPQRQNPPQIDITEPMNGADIESGYVIVKGTLDGPASIGVTVNGIVAEKGGEPYGSEFVARIPLAVGANEIEVLATTLSRQQVSQTLTVNRVGSSPIRFFVSESSGLTPLENRLSLVNEGESPITQVDIDYEGDGAIDETLVDDFERDLLYVYETEGIYYPTAIVTDVDGVQYTLTQVVNAISETRILAQLEDHWSGMNNALNDGNLGLALEHIAASHSEKFSRQFTYLMPRMPEIIASYSSLYVESLSPDHSFVHVVRTIDGENRVFAIGFNQDIFGVWRIISM